MKKGMENKASEREGAKEETDVYGAACLEVTVIRSVGPYSLFREARGPAGAGGIDASPM